MKRILGTVLAMAGVLAFSTAASAATVVFDLNGVQGSWSRSGDDAAADPLTNGGPCGATGMGSTTPGSTLNCFRYTFGAGSSISVDITGSAVTMLGGTLNLINAVAPAAFDTLHLVSNTSTTIYGATADTPAAIGTLTGNTINWLTQANVTTVGTIVCTGATCALVSLPENVPLPFSPVYQALTNSFPVTALNLGTWELDSYNLQILGSTTAITSWSNVADDGNRRVGGLTFGPTLLGLPVPEPGAAALVLLGLGALALRSRKV